MEERVMSKVTLVVDGKTLIDGEYDTVVMSIGNSGEEYFTGKCAVSGGTRDISIGLSDLITELDKKDPIIVTSALANARPRRSHILAETFADLLGKMARDAEEHVHDCATCDMKSDCDLEPAIQYRESVVANIPTEN